jgi:hypothetical protein
MFATVSIPYEAFADLPPVEFKHLVALCRYANKAGVCTASLVQIAADTQTSKTSASRITARLVERGCIERHRAAGNQRYVYTIAKRFLPVWPSQFEVPDVEPAPPDEVPKTEPEVPQRGTQQVSLLSKKKEGLSIEDKARLRWWRRNRTWPVHAGPPPSDPDCWIPERLLEPGDRDTGLDVPPPRVAQGRWFPRTQ